MKHMIWSLLVVCACVEANEPTDSDTTTPDGKADGTGSGTTGTVGGATSARNGSRIKARTLSTADGARVPMGWRDTMLDFDCAFMLAPDGKFRCLPATNYQNTGYFADAQCKISTIEHFDCEGPAKYVKQAAGACGASRLYQAGPQVTTLYQQQAGQYTTLCVLVPPFPYPRGKFYPITDVGADLFAEGT
jgi:hypothetical protein